MSLKALGSEGSEGVEGVMRGTWGPHGPGLGEEQLQVGMRLERDRQEGEDPKVGPGTRSGWCSRPNVACRGAGEG